jgi:Kdo2-lipid IVA lauroyltransferase/acyltransferase
LRHRLEYLLVAVVAFCARHLPWRVLSLAGGTLGLIVYALDVKRRRVTLDNLARAFPGRGAAERRRIARGVYRHFGRLAFEVMKFSALAPDEMVSRVDIEGGEHVRQAYAAGRGVFFLTAHFGCWEMHGLAHSVYLAPIGVVARPVDNPLVNDFLERARQGTGNRVIYRKGGTRRILRALQSGQGVAILIDQHIHGPDATYVDFFGRRAATTTALAGLALRTGAPVIPVFAIPTAPGRYRLIYEHAVEMPPPDSPDPVRELTQRCTDVLEMYVRRYPELWLWMHRRWRDAGTGAAASDDAMSAADADEETENARGPS